MIKTQTAVRLIQGVKHIFPETVTKSSKGLIVETECGRKLTDFTCGIGVANLGHCHPGVTAAVQKAAGTLVHAQMNIMRHRPMLDLIGKLGELKLSRDSGFDAWYLWNGGSDAVEGAVKLARQATQKPNIISFNLGYHGRTYLSMALTTSGTIYRSGFGPLPSGIFPTPFPYTAQGPYSDAALKQRRKSGGASGKSFMLDSGECNYWGATPADVAQMDVARCLANIELMLRTQTNPAETAAFMIEPVLGEGGYVPPPPGFLKGLRNIADKHGILLICDEVQTGFGRTGSFFASEWIDGGVRPDIIITAKGLANGFPLSAVGTRSDLASKQPGGSMGGTYGGV